MGNGSAVDFAIIFRRIFHSAAFNLSDRQAERQILDNVAYQVFCRASIFDQWPCPDHTKIEEFRSRLSPETQCALANVIAHLALRYGLQNHRVSQNLRNTAVFDAWFFFGPPFFAFSTTLVDNFVCNVSTDANSHVTPCFSHFDRFLPGDFPLGFRLSGYSIFTVL